MCRLIVEGSSPLRCFDPFVGCRFESITLILINFYLNN